MDAHELRPEALRQVGEEQRRRAVVGRGLVDVPAVELDAGIGQVAQDGLRARPDRQEGAQLGGALGDPGLLVLVLVVLDHVDELMGQHIEVSRRLKGHVIRRDHKHLMLVAGGEDLPRVDAGVVEVAAD